MCVFSLHIPECCLCHRLSKNCVPETFNFYFAPVQGKVCSGIPVIYGRRIGTSKIKGDCVQVSYELD